MTTDGKIATAEWSVLCRILCVLTLPFTCCGCPPVPPSQDEQRGVVPSRWIMVDSALVTENKTSEQKAPRVHLNQDDVDAIVANLPVISTAVVERTHSGTISSEKTELTVEVCATRPDYLQLLKDKAGVDLAAGRFLQEVETEEGKPVVVLSQEMAGKLFEDSDPVGQTVTLERHELTVVGIVKKGVGAQAKEVVRDAYVPLKLFGPAIGEGLESEFQYDRVCVRVERLDQVDDARSIIRNVLKIRGQNAAFQVR